MSTSSQEQATLYLQRRGGIFSRRRSSCERQRGAETLGGALALLVFLPLLFIIIDVGWGIFVKVTLQHAVREGVRFAITSQVSNDASGNALGHVGSIKSVVMANSAGLLTGQEEKIKVEFFQPNDLTTSVSGPSANIGGNVVMVTVENYAYRPLIIFGDGDRVKVKGDPPIYMTVHAADRMEACPLGACAPI